MESGHIRGSARRGSSHCAGAREPRASQPGAALSWPVSPGNLARLLQPSGLCGLSPGHCTAASRPQLLLGLRPPEPSVTLSC